MTAMLAARPSKLRLPCAIMVRAMTVVCDERPEPIDDVASEASA